MIVEVEQNVLNLFNAEPGDKFGIVLSSCYPDGNIYQKTRFVSLVVQSNLNDVVCIDEDFEEVHFDKNVLVHDAYLPHNKRFAALAKEQSNMNLIRKAMISVGLIRQYGFNLNDAEDMELVRRLIAFGKAKEANCS